ncbi:MAG: hypothetical protein RIF46_09865, partial [Cyclobacteriaceae bacterium]
MKLYLSNNDIAMGKLFYSRYHIYSGKDLSNKVDFLLTGLRNDASISDRGFVYKFFNSQIHDYHGIEFISGQLVKYNPNDLEEVVDDETMSLRDENVRNKVVAKALYIIDTSSSILMHFEVPNLISKESFRKKFCQLFERNHDNFFTEFALSPIKEQYSFVEKIKTFKSIKRVNITLYPSNPNFSDRWQEIDERLRSNDIAKYREIQENLNPESSIKIDDQTESKFLMSEDGYGDSNATGVD